TNSSPKCVSGYFYFASAAPDGRAASAMTESSCCRTNFEPSSESKAKFAAFRRRRPMAVTMRNRMALTRRAVMKSTFATAAWSVIGGIACPSLSFAPDRPQITHGIQSGDVSTGSGVVWARADRPARMLVEVATTNTFRNIRRGVFVDALPESDFTAKALLDDLPP